MADTAYITYTDAIEALKVLGHEKFRLADDFQPYINALVDACDRIEAIPSADVVEVRHGKWLWDGYVYDAPFVCSCCGTNMGYESNFCPNCGAGMRGWA